MALCAFQTTPCKAEALVKEHEEELALGLHVMSLACNTTNNNNNVSVTSEFPPYLDEELMRMEFPHHRPDVARLNHGSYGSCPVSVLSTQAEFQRQWLEQPDEFYFDHLEKGLLQSRAAVAKVVDSADAEEIVFVDNATTAAVIIAQDISWGFVEQRYKPGDAVLMLSCSYGAVKNCFRSYAARAGARIIEAEIKLPVRSSQQIVDSFVQCFKAAERDRTRIILAVIDHITSMPTLVLPVKQLVQLCQASGVEQVFVDGAHSVGNVIFSVDDINADYYCGNLHKWCFTPSSVAFLHVKKRHLGRLHHPVVSHNYCRGLWSECSWVGTRDYSAQLAVAASVDFIEKKLGGFKRLTSFNCRKALEMGHMLAAAWGTRLGSDKELVSSMVMVELPGKVSVRSEEAALELRTRLRREFKVEVPVYFQGGGSPSGFAAYVRVSHQVYNRREDYIRLRDAVLKLASH